MMLFYLIWYWDVWKVKTSKTSYMSIAHVFLYGMLGSFLNIVDFNLVVKVC